MSWVVDTCMVIDVLEEDPTFGRPSAVALDARSDQGLVLCPLSYVELAPAFMGRRSLQDEFLAGVGIADQPWTSSDTAASHAAWHRYVTARRRRAVGKRPLADVLIGAFAERFDGLLTRNESDFRALFPDLEILGPPA